MKKVIVGSLLCSALAVSPVMAGEDFHALGALSPSLAPMTDTQLESVEAGLFNFGNIAVVIQVNQCKKSICVNYSNVNQKVVYK
ncbi:MAG: hypothetical protein ACRD8U_16970 [Pyrinomonadaceae bacterium]